MKITASHIKKSFQDAERELVVLSDFSFQFDSGRSFAIVGRSGVGKSTLLHILGGLDRPTSGHVAYDDLTLDSLSTDDLALFRGKNVGFVFQSSNLLPEFSALENVMMPLIIMGESESVRVSKSKELLDRVGLSGRLSHRPSQLSGGEAQRVAIARALVASPTVLLADEPTGNLDLDTAREVEDLLLSISLELKQTLVLVTHSRELAERADTSIELRSGGLPIVLKQR